MRSRRRLASIGVALAAFSRLANATELPEQPIVRIGIVLDRPVVAAARHAAAMIAEADAIWRPHGVTVLLTPSVDPPLGDVRLTLTFESARGQRGKAEGLGSIWFDEDGRPAEVIVVDLAAVVARIRQGTVNGRALDAWPPAFGNLITARALGRVLAHELGHYLLAWRVHARAGLMRAAFDGRELAAWDRRGFMLDRHVLPRLRARLARLESARALLAAARQAVP